MNIGFKTPAKLLGMLFLRLSNLPMPGHWRWGFVKLGGVNILASNGYKKFVYIGDGVVWDTAYPEEIEIGNNVHITTGCVLLTHYMSIDSRGWISSSRTHKD